jgi:hypothetical protein
MASTTEHAPANVTRASIRRRFRLLDAMILVAATAIGFGAIGWLARLSGVSVLDARDEVSETLPQQGRQITAEAIATFCAMGAGLVTPLIAAWALALIPIRLISPRPRWRRLASQPGTMAVCSSVVVLAALGLLITCALLVPGGGYDASVVAAFAEGTLVLSPVFFGLTVAATWMSLLLGRRWRAERSWVDRAGRALGCFWIVAGLLVIYFLAVQLRGQPFTTSTPVRSASSSEPVSETE